MLLGRHNGERCAGGETYLGERCCWGDITGRRVLVGRHNGEGGAAGET